MAEHLGLNLRKAIRYAMERHGWNLEGSNELGTNVLHLSLVPDRHHPARDWAASWKPFIWTPTIYVHVPGWFEDELAKQREAERPPILPTVREELDRKRKKTLLRDNELLKEHILKLQLELQEAEMKAAKKSRSLTALCLSCGKTHEYPIGIACPFI